MILINREKKVIENIPHQLRMWSPFKQAKAKDYWTTLKIEELPLYRHGYTRICYLADPEVWLQEAYLRDTSPNEDETTFEDWWVGKKSSPERDLQPLISETRDEDGVCEADIVVDAHKIADWVNPIARALELELREDWKELIPTISTAPADSLVTFKSPMNGSTFYNTYGGDIEDWRAMEGRAFVVA